MSEPSPNRKEPFHWKGLTSFTIAWTFLLMAASGGVLYASPRGRVANWTGWAVAGLDKEAWAVLHIGAAAVFVVATAFHLYFNWTVFTSYFKMRFQKEFHLKREFALATLIAGLVLGGSVAYLPPFSSLADANDAIKDYWEGWRAPAPYPHAEESTIAEFAARTGRDTAAVRAALTSAGYAVGKDVDATLADIAEVNGVTPSALFRAIDPGAMRGGGRGSGPGYGRMTVRQAAGEAGVGVKGALESLRTAGIEAVASDTLRDLANGAGVRPSNVYAIITGDG